MEFSLLYLKWKPNLVKSRQINVLNDSGLCVVLAKSIFVFVPVFCFLAFLIRINLI